MNFEPFGHPPELSLIPGCRSYRLSSWSFTELTEDRVSARLSGRAKGTTVTVFVTVNRHEELSDRSAPYADFDHGSLFFCAPGARQLSGTAESTTKFRFMPVEIRMEGGGLHAYFNRRQASPSTAASGSTKTSGSGQAAPSLDFWVRYKFRRSLGTSDVHRDVPANIGGPRALHT